MKHWTALQAEEAERTPEHARPYCHTHRRHMRWHGSWACSECNPLLRDDRIARLPSDLSVDQHKFTGGSGQTDETTKERA